MAHMFLVVFFVLHFANAAHADSQSLINKSKALLQSVGTDVEEQINEVKGQLQPSVSALISSEISGKITAFNVKEGKSFQKGDVLVTFDCSVLAAEHQKALAVVKAEESRLEVNKKLNDLSSISKLEYALSLHKVEESKADAAIYRVRMKKCSIKAPFNGVVEETMLEPHEYVKAGDPVISLLGNDVLEAEFILPSHWVTKIKPGKKFTINVSETQKNYDASIKRVGVAIDPISQSIKIVGFVDNEKSDLLPGMSFSAHFGVE